MEKKESKNKKCGEDVSQVEDELVDETETEGFPKDVDFRKFLGCGG
ncbi:MAG: hypothetical protein ABJP45_08470 [Cyclobacteriaceae bacterium]